MNLRWRVFINTLLAIVAVASAVTTLFYIILKDDNKARFQSKYETTFSILRDALVALEVDAEQIARNASFVYKDYVRRHGIPNYNEAKSIGKNLSIDYLFAIDNKGEVILSTNPFTPEDHKNIKFNLFKICEDYRKILTDDIIEQTPIIFNQLLGKSTKYTMISSADRKYILEVGVSVDPIFERIKNVFNSDRNITDLTLASPDGTILISHSKRPRVPDEPKKTSIDIPKELMTTEAMVQVARWTDDGLILTTKIQPKTKSALCCECATKPIAMDLTAKYFYVVSATISTAEIQKNMNKAVNWIIAATAIVLFLALGFAEYNSKVLTRGLNKVRGHIEAEKENIMDMKAMEIEGPEEITDIAKSYNGLLNRAKELHSKSLDAQKDKLLATQGKVAFHDANNSINTLEILVDQLHSVPDALRNQIKYSVKNIANIINEGQLSVITGNLRSHLLYTLLDLIISESAIAAQKENPNVEIILHDPKENYFIFSVIEANYFQRVISNVIKNSVQSISNSGKVEVWLESEDDKAVIRIKDNGKGISSRILSKIYDQGFTSGKPNGQGFGLSQAKKNLERWNGSIFTSSLEGAGTETQILIPKSDPPSIFTNKIELKGVNTILVLDDDRLVHVDIEEKIKSNPNLSKTGLQIIHVYTANELEESMREFRNKNQAENILFIMDHDLRDENDITGIDLIRKYDIGKNSLLVTHQWNESTVQEECEKLNVKIIPKRIFTYIPIIYIPNHLKKYDCVIIDDEVRYLNAIEDAATDENKVILTFSRASDFNLQASYISKDTPICFDLNLRAEKSGEDEADRWKEMGFKKLFCISGGATESKYPRRSKKCPWSDMTIGNEE